MPKPCFVGAILESRTITICISKQLQHIYIYVGHIHMHTYSYYTNIKYIKYRSNCDPVNMEGSLAPSVPFVVRNDDQERAAYYYFTY